MKKLTALVLALLMLTSCTRDTPTQEETAQPDPPAEYLYPMEDFVITRTEGYLSTSLTKTAQLTEYRDELESWMSNSAPMVQIIGDKTYLMRRFPDEAVGTYETIRMFPEPIPWDEHVNQVEIYTDGNYDTPSEVITLTGHADTMLRFDEFEYLPDSDTFVTLQSYYHIDDPKVLTVRTFDGDGKMLSEKDIIPPNYDFDATVPIEMRLMGGDLYYVRQETTIYRYHMDTDTETIVNGGVNGFTVSDGKIVYIRHAAGDDYELEYRVCEYDPEKDLSFVLGKLACDPAKQMIQKNSWMRIAYDRENKTLYYDPRVYTIHMPAGIRAAKLNGEEFVQVLAKSDSDQFIDRLTISGGQLMVQLGNYQILLYEVPEVPVAFDKNMELLRFCLLGGDVTNAFGYQSNVFRLMEMSGTMAKAEGTYLSADPDEYAYTMAKKLLAGDTDFDIFMVTTETAELLKEGYYEDLSRFRLVDEAVNAMIPGLKELCTIGDTFALCPIDYPNVEMLQVHNDRVIGGIPAFSTFPELVNLASALQFSGDKVGFMAGYTHLRMVLPWFEQYAANFMAETVDDEQAKADLIQLYRSADALIRSDAAAYGDSYRSCQPVFQVNRNHGVGSDVPSGKSVLPIVPAASGYRQSVEGRFYAVNPNSPNKELAAKFLACYLDNTSSVNLTGIRHENFTYPEGSEQTEALYREQIADGVLAWAIPELETRVGTHLTGIREGTVTPEQAADELFKYVKMIRDE